MRQRALDVQRTDKVPKSLGAIDVEIPPVKKCRKLASEIHLQHVLEAYRGVLQRIVKRIHGWIQEGEAQGSCTDFQTRRTKCTEGPKGRTVG